ncbi:MAG TPA: (2Fe-2S)-binding protein [bacterium]|nr:(2Fe-2S)-binding protein [bacterium]
MIELSINDKAYRVEVQPGETLLEVLRGLGFKGVKKSCETGNCGACTVLLDSRPVASCILLAFQAEGRSITTVEGLSQDHRLTAIQEAFIEASAPQCGYCTPGMLLTTVALLAQNPEPTRAEIREAISGNICRCSGYVKIVDAIEQAARSLRLK